MQADTELDSQEPSTLTGATASATATSAVKRKFEYRLPFEFGVERDSRARNQPIETCITRCTMMSSLGLLWLECSLPSLKIRAVGHRFGVVSA